MAPGAAGRVGKRGTLVIPAKLRRRFHLKVAWDCCLARNQGGAASVSVGLYPSLTAGRPHAGATDCGLHHGKKHVGVIHRAAQ